MSGSYCIRATLFLYMIFEYLYTTTALDSIDIEDIGNFVLNAFTDEGEEYYLYINTLLGETTIQQIGPLTIDSNVLPNYFVYSYQKMQYNDKKIISIIDKFLTDSRKQITQVFFSNPLDFKQRLEDLKHG